MRPITNQDAAERVMGRWHAGDMALVNALVYRVREDGSGSDLEVEFTACRRERETTAWPWAIEPKYVVTIRFGGIRDLKLSDFGGPYTQLSGFEITDTSGRGWEADLYQVDDYEDGRISLQCEEVEILEVKPLRGR